MRHRSGWLATLAILSGFAGAPGLAVASTETAPIRVGTFSGAYLAGRAAEADNDLAGAIRYYERALSFEPDDQAVQQSVMLALIANGDIDKALPYAQKLQSVADVERFSRVALAVGAFQAKQYDRAEHWLKLALESDLDRLITGVMTAWAKAGAGDAKAAMAHLDALQGPDWYGLFRNYHRALIADFAGLTEEAAKAYDAAVVARSTADVAPEVYLRLVEAYSGFLARQGRKEEALSNLQRTDEFSPGRPTAADLRLRIGMGQQIAPLTADPSSGAAEILLNVASALNRGGGEAFVRLYLQMARALRPNDDAILMQLGAVAEQQDSLEEAIAIYTDIPDTSPLKRIAEMQLGLNLAELDRKEEAVQHLKAVLEKSPEDNRAYLALGGVYASDEKYREAAEVYDRAVARLTNPQKSDWNIFYQRGIAYERLKEWPKAEPNFRKALELFPNQPQVLNYLGYSWVDMNINLEEGLEMIKTAVELRPTDGYIVDSLGWAYYRLGRFEDAVRELERAVALQPSDPVLNDHLGDAYWRTGRKLEAQFQWTHARDMKPDPDVLATVVKKLAEGLPPLEQRTEAGPAIVPPAPPEKPAQRSEL